MFLLKYVFLYIVNIHNTVPDCPDQKNNDFGYVAVWVTVLSQKLNRKDSSAKFRSQEVI